MRSVLIAASTSRVAAQWKAVAAELISDPDEPMPEISRQEQLTELVAATTPVWRTSNGSDLGLPGQRYSTGGQLTILKQ